MNNSDEDQSLIDNLKAQKLEIEICELTRPAWKKTSFWLAAVPIVLAVIASYQVYVKDIFRIEGRIIELRKLELKRTEAELQETTKKNQTEIAQLKQDLQSESEQIKANFERQSKEVSQKTADLQSEFAAKTAKLNADLVELNSEKSQLKQSVSELNAEKQAAIESLNFERKIGPTRSDIKELNKCLENGEAECDLYSTVVKRLILVAQEDPSDPRRMLLEKTLLDSQSKLEKTLILAIFYTAHQTEIYREPLLSEFESITKNTDKVIWRIFSSLRWERVERQNSIAVRAWETALSTAQRLNMTQVDIVALGLGFEPHHTRNVAGKFENKDLFYYGLGMGIDIALNRKLDSGQRYRGLRIVAALAPEVFMVTTARIAIDPTTKSHMWTEIINMISYARNDFRDHLRKKGYPEKQSDDWEGWIKRNPKLSTLWRDSDKDSLKRDFQLAEKLQ